MRKLGLSLAYPYCNPAFYDEMAAAGISAAELSVAPPFCPAMSFSRAAAEMQAAGITPWSFHFPFEPFEVLNPASPDPSVRAETLRYLSELVRRASDAGFLRFVLHASGEPIAEQDRPEAMKHACESVAKLGDVCASCGAVLAVEDLPRTCLGNCSGDILTLIGNHPAVGVCFDTNHITAESDEDFLRAVAARLVTVHISDFDFYNERHWLPGEGKIDWVSLMNVFDEVGYDGVFLYEVSFKSTRTIARERPLAPRDFYENAKALHERRPLTAHGTPYPDLGMWGPKSEE